MIIEILVKNDDDSLVGKREANNWESAEENFGKLERAFKEIVEDDMQADGRESQEKELEDLENENV